MIERADIVIVGAGAAGLMAAISAGRAARERGAPLRIAVLDGARRPGAKILVSGGGRCNVTHDAVDETAFSGSSPHAIRKVLRRFAVPQTVQFFEGLGVELKREETGKLFPVADDARTVLNALLTGVRQVGVELGFSARIDRIARTVESPSAVGRFRLSGSFGEVQARRVILATGGMSLPKTGSDGRGFEMARSLGHTTTPLLLPALVPLVLQPTCFLRQLSGVTTDATVEVRTAKKKRLVSFTGALLCTHFGVSGPAVLDISGPYLRAKSVDPETALYLNWLPGEQPQTVEASLLSEARHGRGTVARHLSKRLPHRLAEAICRHVGIEPDLRLSELQRGHRRLLASALTTMAVPVIGDRGFRHAEVTAGGVPLAELHLEMMESRVCPGLHLCGEMCDVDGRIGGYNFQWAWSSGFVAGTGSIRCLLDEPAGA